MALRFWQQATRLKQSRNMIMLAVLTIWHSGPKHTTKSHFQAIWAEVLRCLLFCPPCPGLTTTLVFKRVPVLRRPIYSHSPMTTLTLAHNGLSWFIKANSFSYESSIFSLNIFLWNQYYDPFIKWWNKQEYFGVIIKEKR